MESRSLALLTAASLWASPRLVLAVKSTAAWGERPVQGAAHLLVGGQGPLPLAAEVTLPAVSPASQGAAPKRDSSEPATGPEGTMGLLCAASGRGGRGLRQMSRATQI